MKSSVKLDFKNSPKPQNTAVQDCTGSTAVRLGGGKEKGQLSGPRPQIPKPPGNISSKKRGPTWAGALQPGARKCWQTECTLSVSEQERSQHSQGLRRAGQCCLVHRAIRQTLHSEGSPPAEGTRWERPSHETGIKAPKGRRVGHPEQVPNGKQHQKAGQPAPLKACTAWSSERQTSTWVLYEMGRPPWLPCSPHRTGGPPPHTHRDTLEMRSCPTQYDKKKKVEWID